MCELERGESDLVLSGAHARPHERIGPKITLDVGRNNFSRDAIARHKPLVCARHDDREECREGTKRKKTLMSDQSLGRAKLCKPSGTRRGLRVPDNAPERTRSARMDNVGSCGV
jgi:hypothetical protein